MFINIFLSCVITCRHTWTPLIEGFTSSTQFALWISYFRSCVHNQVVTALISWTFWQIHLSNSNEQHASDVCCRKPCLIQDHIAYNIRPNEWTTSTRGSSPGLFIFFKRVVVGCCSSVIYPKAVWALLSWPQCHDSVYVPYHDVLNQDSIPDSSLDSGLSQFQISLLVGWIANSGLTLSQTSW